MSLAARQQSTPQTANTESQVVHTQDGGVSEALQSIEIPPQAPCAVHADTGNGMGEDVAGRRDRHLGE